MMKFRLYYDKDAACEWLNEMAAQGWRTVWFGGGFFRFAPCDLSQYTYRMDFSGHFGYVSADYRDLMQDMGFAIVNVWGPWVLLEAPGDADVPPLYTDSESGEAQARRMFTFFRTMALLMLLLCMLMAVLGTDAQEGGASVLEGIAVAFSAIMAFVFLRQCRRLQNRIDALRADRGAAPTAWRRVPVLMLAGLAILEAGLLGRPAMEHIPGLYQTVAWIGMAVWAAGMFQHFTRKE